MLIPVFGTVLASAQTLCTNILPGTVVAFKAPASGYQFNHSRRAKPFGMYSQLEPGDRLEILDEHSFVEVEDAAERTKHYTIADAPLCVTVGPSVSWSSEAVSVLKQRFLRAQDGDPHSLSSRGAADSLSLGMYSLRSGTAMVGKGLRTFALSWAGGVAPFHLTVTSPSQQVVLDEYMINQRLMVKRAPIKLVAGIYHIRLTDSHNTFVTGSFTAGTPIFSEKDALAEGDRRHVETVAEILASHPERSFDAYLWLSSVVSRPAIRGLMDALAEGDVPENAINKHQ